MVCDTKLGTDAMQGQFFPYFGLTILGLVLVPLSYSTFTPSKRMCSPQHPPPLPPPFPDIINLLCRNWSLQSASDKKRGLQCPPVWKRGGLAPPASKEGEAVEAIHCARPWLGSVWICVLSDCHDRRRRNQDLGSLHNLGNQHGVLALEFCFCPMGGANGDL